MARPSQTPTFSARYADAIIKHRWAALIGSLVIVLLIASGVHRFAFGNNYRLFFSDDNPELLALEDFQDTYTKNDNILFVVQPKNPKEGQIFTNEVAVAIDELTEEAWKLPFAIRVDSITNYQHTWAAGDDLTVEDLIVDPAGADRQLLNDRKAVALAEPQLNGNVISPDADTTGINVTFQYPELNDTTEVPLAAKKARELAARINEKHPDLTIALTGLSMLNASFAEASERDFRLLGLMFVMIIVVAALSLRQFFGTAATLVVIILSMAAGLGFGCWIGYKITPISFTAPIVIITLAIADSIHILVSMRKAQLMGMEKIEALKESLRINFVPVSITSLTTIIGFLALNFSETPPFWHLGNMTAAGIAVAWLLSLTFLPAVVSLLPCRAPKPTAAGAQNGLLSRWADFVIHRQHLVLGVSGVIALGFAALAPMIQLNDEWIKYFDKRMKFRNDAQFGIDHLTGIYLIEYSVESGEEGGIADPEYLEKLESFTNWLRDHEHVTHVLSFSDIIKRLNKNMHADEQEYYRIPEDRELAAQYILLYELSLPFGLDLNNRVAIDKSATRVTVTLPEISTKKVRGFIEESEQWFDQNTPESMAAKGTGPTVMFAHVAKRNVEQMLTGNAIAIVLIAIVLAIALRSIKLGALSLIPNSLPILITFGIWAVTVKLVGMAAATVTSTSLGIVVDDTVHFLSKYLYARRDKGMDREDAIRYAFNTVGSALVTTTVVLSIGFGVLAFSSFKINGEMGLLTSIAIVVAFVFDFTLLPALLLFGSKLKKKTHEKLA